MSITTTESAETVKAAMGLARDVAEGRVDPHDLPAEFAAEARTLFGDVVRA